MQTYLLLQPADDALRSRVSGVSGDATQDPLVAESSWAAIVRLPSSPSPPPDGSAKKLDNVFISFQHGYIYSIGTKNMELDADLG